MKHRADQIRATKAALREMPAGWLAVSEPGSVLSVGTVGPTRDAAAAGFAAEIEAWAVLAEQPHDAGGVRSEDE
jgi:hypothetical protein